MMDTITGAGTAISTWDGALTTLGTTPGITVDGTVGIVLGTTAGGIHPGIMVDGTTRGFTEAGIAHGTTADGIRHGIMADGMIHGTMATVTVEVITMVSMTDITAAYPEIDREAAPAPIAGVQQTEQPLLRPLYPAGQAPVPARHFPGGQAIKLARQYPDGEQPMPQGLGSSIPRAGRTIPEPDVLLIVPVQLHARVR